MKSLRGLMVVPAVAVAVALGATAVGATTTARLAPPATVNADGTVSVPVEYTCDNNRKGDVYVSLEQQKAQAYTDGFGYVAVDCSGTRQVVDVLVRPNWGPFDNGRAVAKLSFYSWVPYPGTGPSENVQEAGVIRLSN